MAHSSAGREREMCRVSFSEVTADDRSRRPESLDRMVRAFAASCRVAGPRRPRHATGPTRASWLRTGVLRPGRARAVPPRHGRGQRLRPGVAAHAEDPPQRGAHAATGWKDPRTRGSLARWSDRTDPMLPALCADR